MFARDGGAFLFRWRGQRCATVCVTDVRVSTVCISLWSLDAWCCKFLEVRPPAFQHSRAFKCCVVEVQRLGCCLTSFSVLNDMEEVSGLTYWPVQSLRAGDCGLLHETGGGWT